MRRTLLASLLFAATASVAAAAIAWPSGPPSIAPRPVVDTYPGGHSVVDPYRYLQNLKSPEVQAYFKAQANYSSDILAQAASSTRSHDFLILRASTTASSISSARPA